MADILEQLQSKPAPRAVFLYTVPATVDAQYGGKKIGLVKLTAREQKDATSRALAAGAADGNAIFMEYAKASCVLADSRKLAAADGSLDVFWDGADTKLRNMIFSIWRLKNMPSEDELEAASKSEEVQFI